MAKERPPAWRDHLEGVALFLFIPLVLFLYVAHPEPISWSLSLGVILMIAHRRIARPYMRKVAPRLCLWTHRRLDDVPESETVEIELHTRAGVQGAHALATHGDDIRRFFTFVRLARPVLATGIFVPLAFLLGTLAMVALGGRPLVPLATATAIFQLSVGITVNIAAWGYLGVRQLDERVSVGFPAHNFFLLGLRTLLWVFRLVGVTWIVRGLLHFI